MTAAAVAARLHARRARAGWVARCPAHEDRRASLSIGEGAGRSRAAALSRALYA